MEKRLLELLEMQKTAGKSSYADNNITVPSCINGDFCNPEPKEINNGILTMAFVDSQPLDSVYSPEKALKNGTLFPNINKPFLCGGKSYE